MASPRVLERSCCGFRPKFWVWVVVNWCEIALGVDTNECIVAMFIYMYTPHVGSAGEAWSDIPVSTDRVQ